VLDGIFYQADVWFDGAYLGDPEGYFFPHSFDVTQLARLGDEHVLAVEVACTPHLRSPADGAQRSKCVRSKSGPSLVANAGSLRQ
jgi:beta-galactosidase/beta-glucuronidase